MGPEWATSRASAGGSAAEKALAAGRCKPPPLLARRQHFHVDGQAPGACAHGRHQVEVLLLAAQAAAALLGEGVQHGAAQRRGRGLGAAADAERDAEARARLRAAAHHKPQRPVPRALVAHPIRAAPHAVCFEDPVARQHLRPGVAGVPPPDEAGRDGLDPPGLAILGGEVQAEPVVRRLVHGDDIRLALGDLRARAPGPRLALELDPAMAPRRPEAAAGPDAARRRGMSKHLEAVSAEGRQVQDERRRDHGGVAANESALVGLPPDTGTAGWQGRACHRVAEPWGANSARVRCKRSWQGAMAGGAPVAVVVLLRLQALLQVLLIVSLLLLPPQPVRLRNIRLKRRPMLL
mmetsp:Transcript_7646/g.21786  ORF Transcript_7646/g.21786 Transcript_7646/m.21786 type:complete len:350 (-) Transcript_7646:53-1102(-)